MLPIPTRIVTLLLFLLACVASAQVSIPLFGTRGEVPASLTEAFTTQLRREVRRAGLEVTEGELITAGIAGSLEPDFANLIAELDGVRYAVSGELSRVADPQGQEPYLVNLIVVDAEQDRSSDLISRPLSPQHLAEAAADLAGAIAAFSRQQTSLAGGEAGLFVSSQPGEAEVFVDGVKVGTTSDLDVLMLADGRHQLEVRKEGFLPETRTVDLRSGDTRFVHLLLTAIAGGSIRLESSPAARVYLDDSLQGTTPLTLGARPGTPRLRLERQGFVPLVVSVPVRNYRISRLDLRLEPLLEPLLFWAERRDAQVYVGGRLQPGGYATGVRAGPVTVEVRRGGESRFFDLVLPATGAYELDLDSGRLTPQGR